MVPLTMPEVVNMRLLLAMVVALGVLSTQAGRGTLSFFTDSATSSGNTFSTGTIDIALANGTGTVDCDGMGAGTDTLGVVLNESLRKPGDFKTVGICVKNAGTLNTQWSLASTVSDNTDNFTLLKSVMKMRIWTLTAATATNATACIEGFDSAGNSTTMVTQTDFGAEVYSTALLSTNPSVPAGANTQINVGQFQKVCFSAVLPSGTPDNEPAAATTIQGKIVTANFTFTGNQF